MLLNGQERITSPEQLNSYIRVTNPGVWTVLAAILVLLCAAFFWMFTGTMEDSVALQVFSGGGRITGFVPADVSGEISSGMRVRLGRAEGTVSEVSSQPMSYYELSRMTGEGVLTAMHITPNERLCIVSVSADNAPEGVSRA